MTAADLTRLIADTARLWAEAIPPRFLRLDDPNALIGLSDALALDGLEICATDLQLLWNDALEHAYRARAASRLDPPEGSILDPDQG